ncbi:hypothetical protein D3C78_903830 [compost metagenome]
MDMAQQHHDHRRHRQGQQNAGETEQFTAGENGENHRHRMQADAITDQQWRQDHAFQCLADHEYRCDRQ